MINKQHPLINLWESTGNDLFELTSVLSTTIQDRLLEVFSPPDKKILEWKASSNGFLLFINHIESHGIKLSYDTYQLLWRYYTKQFVQRIKIDLNNIERVCQHCGNTDGPFHIDHIIPITKGGTNEFCNLQILCKSCNLKKLNKFDKNKIAIKRKGD